MQVKALEVRDRNTFIAVLAVDMNPSTGEPPMSEDQYNGRLYLLRRCGYPCDGRANILMTRLDGNGQATNDPYAWADGSRTLKVAHNYIIDNWNNLRNGDVVCVEWILSERSEPKVSERVNSTLNEGA